MRTENRLPPRRRLALAMFLLWLFATVASWANACAVPAPAPTLHAHAHHAGISKSAQPADDRHSPSEACAADMPDPAEPACASFCDTARSIVAKAQPSKGDAGDATALPPGSATGIWPAPRAPRAEPRWRTLATPPPPGPPVAIAFLRLLC
jgi:hypothetical protein